jgi:hypothetical protein
LPALIFGIPTIPWPVLANRAVGVLIWVGGIAATIFGSWVASKIHVYHEAKRAHYEDIKQRVLNPIRDGLFEHFPRLTLGVEPIVSVQRGAIELFENAKVTEETAQHGEMLVAADPGRIIFGSVDGALYRDTVKTHFFELSVMVDRFLEEWNAYANECRSWAAEISQLILSESGLVPFPPKPGPLVPRSYVMHLRLAVFVYARLFGMLTPALRTESQGAEWGLHGDSVTLAWGSKEQIDRLVELLDRLVQSEATKGRLLHHRLPKINEALGDVNRELEFAIASRRLRKRCDLVTFF